jgi:hypothetical protein
VSRKKYWPQSALPGYWSASSDALGTSEPATAWYFAGGLTGGPAQETMYLLVLNPTSTPGQVQVTLTPDGGSVPLTQKFNANDL